jgi:hypothetical protein
VHANRRSNSRNASAEESRKAAEGEYSPFWTLELVSHRFWLALILSPVHEPRSKVAPGVKTSGDANNDENSPNCERTDDRANDPTSSSPIRSSSTHSGQDIDGAAIPASPHDAIGRAVSTPSAFVDGYTAAATTTTATPARALGHASGLPLAFLPRIAVLPCTPAVLRVTSEATSSSTSLGATSPDVSSPSVTRKPEVVSSPTLFERYRVFIDSVQPPIVVQGAAWRPGRAFTPRYVIISDFSLCTIFQLTPLMVRNLCGLELASQCHTKQEPKPTLAQFSPFWDQLPDDVKDVSQLHLLCSVKCSYVHYRYGTRYPYNGNPLLMVQRMLHLRRAGLAVEPKSDFSAYIYTCIMYVCLILCCCSTSDASELLEPPCPLG